MEHICNQADKIAAQDKKIDQLFFAMFGDDKVGEIGTKKKVDEIHKLLTEGNAIKKFIIWSFSTIVGAAAFIYTVVHITEDVKK